VLAFNLGVFFRNLAGAEVDFAAKNAQCDFHFVGSVQDFRQEQDVGTQLSVALRHEGLVCTLSIVDEEADEAPEDAMVEVRLLQQVEGGARELLHTTFRFEGISLKPHVEPQPGEAEAGADAPSGPPPKVS
jgi:hypothetical protein